MSASVLVNKVPYDFQSLEIELSSFGVSIGIIEGIDEIEYNTSINRETFYGSGRIPKLRSGGVAEYDASITMARYWWDYLVNVAKLRRVGLANLAMTMSVSYEDPATRLVVTDTLTGVAMKEIGNSHSSGSELLTVSVPLDVMNIYYSGVDVFGGMLGI